MCTICQEHEGRECPICGDTMTEKHDNYLPTWSDRHDDIVCWSCANHDLQAFSA